jgi:predicted metalloprotease with PDZ domain
MIHYEVSIARPNDHFFQIKIRFTPTSANAKSCRIRLPSWIPGSYMVRDFARQVRGLQVFCSSIGGHASKRQATPVRPLDKDSWEFAITPSCSEVAIRYEVYAFDNSVRTAYLDQYRGFFNASSLLFAVEGAEAQPCEVLLTKPSGMISRDGGRVKLATGLSPVKLDRDGFGTYAARDYDELIDCPVEISAFEEFSFKAGGAQHRFTLSGSLGEYTDLARLRHDVQRICQTQCAFFEPETQKAPFKHYSFMLSVLGNGYGGLEHRNSTALICSRRDLDPNNSEYQTLLGLISHEYFHSWNVKRIKPQVFAPYQLQQENYTRLLWLFEGFTSYYDDLLALRSGAITQAQYLDALGKTIGQVHNAAGRHFQSLGESSFFAWTKYYKQDENSPNSIVSYYAKGALVALCLDLEIRHQSKHRKSLDDVMRLLWQKLGRQFDRQGYGLAEDTFPDFVQEACGLNLREQIQRWTETTEELPLESLLATAAVSLESKEVDSLESLWGAKYRVGPQGIEVTQVRSGSIAEASGLAMGDHVIALHRHKVSEALLSSALKRGGSLDLQVFRSEVLLDLKLKIEEAHQKVRLKTWSLRPMVRPNAVARRGLLAWLGKTSDKK